MQIYLDKNMNYLIWLRLIELLIGLGMVQIIVLNSTSWYLLLGTVVCVEIQTVPKLIADKGNI